MIRAPRFSLADPKAWLALLFAVWVLWAIVQFGLDLKLALDLRDEKSQLSAAELSFFWNERGELLGRFADSRVPADGRVVLLGMSVPDANIAAYHLYPRTVLRASATSPDLLTPDTYLLFFVGDGAGEIADPGRIEASVKAAGLDSEAIAFEGEDGSKAILLDLKG